MEQKVTSTTTKGLIISLILIAISLVMYFGNIDMDGPLRWIGLIIFVAAIIWAVSSYGKQINYNSTFGNYFANGFKTTAVVTVIMIIFTVISFLIFPDIKEKILEKTHEQMLKNSTTSPDQMEQGFETFKRLFWVFTIGGVIVVYLIAGVIGSLIGAAVTKKNPNEFGNTVNQIGQ